MAGGMSVGKSLHELGLKEEALPTTVQNLDDLPEFGAFRIPPQPGDYRFRLPADLSSVWEVYDGRDGKGQRVRAIFDRDHPLVIVQSTNPQYLNEPFECRISNEERARGKNGVIASDMQFLLRALGEKVSPANNRAYITTLLPYAGKDVGATLSYSWRCNDQRNIRVRDEAGNVQEAEQKGCGAGYYYPRDVQKGEDGLVPTEITCTCGALVRCFANLDSFRS